jgi:uncharacterized protein YeaO (DUF488 family)
MEHPSETNPGEAPIFPAGAESDKGQGAPGDIKTRRWNDPAEPDDGLRLLVCRYRPRALKKENETWAQWRANLGPSRALHADFYGKKGAPISWEEYRRRYLEEMKDQAEEIARLAEMVAQGTNLTLLCSSACTDETHCHRTLLKDLIVARMKAEG